jgi:hypothetical protein
MVLLFCLPLIIALINTENITDTVIAFPRHY